AATLSLDRTVSCINDLNVKAAVALNPATSVEAVREIAPYIDMVNVMTVEPGFGGQAFIPSSPMKIRRPREVAPDVEIEVDGGIDPETVPLEVAAGATVLVAAIAVYGHNVG